MKSYAPIVLFTYNRPKHTQLTIQNLLKNEEAYDTDLIVYSDAAKTSVDRDHVEQVRRYFCKLKGFRSIKLIERAHNLGLAENIISGVTEVLERYDKLIVLEDDLLTSKYFLKYMNSGLEIYETDERVASIHGYIYPHSTPLPETFFIKGADCWGWATWKRAWKYFEKDGKKLLDELKKSRLTKEFDFNGAYEYTQMLEDWVDKKNNSWAIRWYASAFLNNMLTLYPGTSLVNNIGFDGSGTHCELNSSMHVNLSDKDIEVVKIDIEENKIARKIVMKSLGHSKRIPVRLKRILLKFYNKMKSFIKTTRLFFIESKG